MKYKKIIKYKYQLAEDEHILWEAPELEPVEHPYFSIKHLNNRGLTQITAKQGYAWDGASGPTIDTPNTMRPSLFHDVLCQCIRIKAISKKHQYLVNKIFKYLLKEDGMCRFRRSYYYYAMIFSINSLNPEMS